MTDPIADMLTRIRNAYLAEHSQVILPYSKMKAKIADLMVSVGFLKSVIVEEDKPAKFLKLVLKYVEGKPVVNNIERVSKPGRRVYVKSDKLPRPLSGYGLAIISTSEGLMTNKDAYKKKLGGEVVCEIW